jgi:hypothetical protein
VFGQDGVAKEVFVFIFLPNLIVIIIVMAAQLGRGRWPRFPRRSCGCHPNPNISSTFQVSKISGLSQDFNDLKSAEELLMFSIINDMDYLP